MERLLGLKAYGFGDEIAYLSVHKKSSQEGGASDYSVSETMKGFCIGIYLLIYLESYLNLNFGPATVTWSHQIIPKIDWLAVILKNGLTGFLAFLEPKFMCNMISIAFKWRRMDINFKVCCPQ